MAYLRAASGRAAEDATSGRSIGGRFEIGESRRRLARRPPTPLQRHVTQGQRPWSIVGMRVRRLAPRASGEKRRRWQWEVEA
nr:unnamed protein product [Digitaria exilis]